MTVSINQGEAAQTPLRRVVHRIKSQDRTDFLIRNAHQQLIYNIGSYRMISLEKLLFDFIDEFHRCQHEARDLKFKSFMFIWLS